MQGLRKTGTFLVIILVVIQFIQPVRNRSSGIAENDITRAYAIPEPVRYALSEKCYDCHSNHTRYAWYFHIQPLGWWLAAHVYEGKSQLNFSEFKSYRREEAQQKLKRIAVVMNAGTPHLKRYSLLRPADITPEDERAIQAWVSTLVPADP